jgi:hypothetical protein
MDPLGTSISATDGRGPKFLRSVFLRVLQLVYSSFVTARLGTFANFLWLAAGPLMASGLSKEQADKASKWLLDTLMSFADSAAKKAGIPPWLEEEEPGWLPREMVLEPDWQAAAAYAGEVQANQAANVDIAAGE